MSARQTFKTEVGVKPVDYEFKLDAKAKTSVTAT